jgi:hypothetical protein
MNVKVEVLYIIHIYKLIFYPIQFNSEESYPDTPTWRRGNCVLYYTRDGDRTHAEITPADLKPASLTTRTPVFCT